VSPAQECLCPQDVLEPILVEAGRGNGADIRFGSVLEGFEQDEHGVTATIDGRPVRADYLIACDGAQSPIRRSLGIETTEESETFHSVGISFRADLTELVTDPFILAYITHPDSRGVLLPINNRDRWVFHVRVDPARGEKAADFTRERCEHLIRVATGRSDLDIELTSVAEWATNSSLARGYRTGRVFLAGDAAHAVPPAGALGANTSIQDVHNLAWKLAFVLNGLAGDALLDTYEVERRPVGRMTGDQALIRWHNSEQNSAGTGFVNDVGVMFGVQYVSSAVRNTTLLPPFTVAVDGTPGTRVPHVWLAAGKTTLDLVGPGFTLLHRDEHWARAVAELPIPVRSCRVDWPHADALLVRPDGYVAWRGDDPSALPAAVRDVVAGASVMPGVAP
jgi:putative polyketide hydroxylase